MTFLKSDSAGYLVNHVSRIFARGLAARIAPLELTIGTFPALLELWERDGLTQKQLVARLHIEQATMANTLSRMERDGLILRKKDPTDGRIQRVWLTQRARDLQGDATAAAMDQNTETLKGLTEQEQRDFIQLMKKLIASNST
ncbi:MAG: MarR family transcriptional regulator [Shimia sp.]|nr:MarR family transcriptional regulator [Shimia sp.]